MLGGGCHRRKLITYRHDTARLRALIFSWYPSEIAARRRRKRVLNDLDQILNSLPHQPLLEITMPLLTIRGRRR